MNNDDLKKWYSSLGKKGMAKRWQKHTPMSGDELREYRKLKMREYRQRKKSAKIDTSPLLN